MSAPHFSDGKPTNLEAAALDALEWMQFLEAMLNDSRMSLNNRQWHVQRMRLGRAMDALRTFMPSDAPVFEEKRP